MQFFDNFAVGQAGARAPLAQRTGDVGPPAAPGGAGTTRRVGRFAISMARRSRSRIALLAGRSDRRVGAIGGEGGAGGDTGARLHEVAALRAMAALVEPVVPGAQGEGGGSSTDRRDSDPLRR